MKKSYLASSLTLVFSALALSSSTHAAVVGQSSNSEYITAGESITGNAGIGVPLFGFVNNLQSGLGGLGIADLGVEDENAVHRVNLPYGGSLDLGVFNFAQVGNQDIWYGEWSESGIEGDTTRTVFYSGANADTTIPSSGGAIYQVSGLNNYNGESSSLVEGVLTANFELGTLDGAIFSQDQTRVIYVNDATINSDATITGDNMTGIFNNQSIEDGTISAQLYNGAFDIAGLIDFEGTEYDTAFGGSVYRWVD